MTEDQRDAWKASSYSDGWSAKRPVLNYAGPPDYKIGYIVTPYGVLGLYEQGGEHPHTSFDIVVAGRTHRITWDRQFSDRYKKTLAVRYAASFALGEDRSPDQ